MKSFGTKIKDKIPFAKLTPSDLHKLRAGLVVRVAKKNESIAGLAADIVALENDIVTLEKNIAEIDEKL